MASNPQPVILQRRGLGCVSLFALVIALASVGAWAFGMDSRDAVAAGMSGAGMMCCGCPAVAIACASGVALVMAK